MCLSNSRAVFVPAELSDLEQLLWRLAQGGGVMSAPPPVPHHRSPLGLDLHGLFITFCLDRSLQHLLYVYLEHYRCVALACQSDCSSDADRVFVLRQVDAPELPPAGQSQPVGQSAVV